ncbi:MAG: nuclear transport factor 2 family protein [Saprospiraceae bacterium]|nr:nuclear transport factor 2 family protein [Saprospiraceae bacterium]
MKAQVFALTVGWMLCLGTVTSAQQYIGDRQDIDQILANIRQFSQYYMDGAYSQLAECYTADGKIMPGGAPIIEGQEAIEKRWTLPEGVTVLKHVIHPKEIRVLDDHAYDYGYYEGETLLANGEKSSWKGKYVIVWRKEGGTWKIYLDIWNRVNE